MATKENKTGSSEDKADQSAAIVDMVSCVYKLEALNVGVTFAEVEDRMMQMVAKLPTDLNKVDTKIVKSTAHNDCAAVKKEKEGQQPTQGEQNSKTNPAAWARFSRVIANPKKIEEGTKEALAKDKNRCSSAGSITRRI